jgi:hypothetical protein
MATGQTAAFPDSAQIDKIWLEKKVGTSAPQDGIVSREVAILG